uniref:SRCR domain-containing protein n=1 Tax=Lates calcarifer TaxID=8187 RepID=A0A4W6FY21_LATCA
MDNVNCLGNESSLWHCRARHLGKDTHRCSSIAYVVCSESLNARLVDGPGKCAGRVEIQYKGRWRQVRKDSEWTDDNSNSVCKEMECGKMRKSTGPGKFSQGSGDFLSNPVKCNKDANNISACDIEIERSTAVGNNEAVGVICEDHKVIFLEGNNSCSGKVVIEHGDTSYWLSGSNNTWNSVSGKIVCQQIHCGNFVNFSTVPAEKERSIWSESYYCSDPTTRSLFECKNESSNASDRIATVTCSGNKTVSLTETCWGNVKVCFGGKCGGVCADSWTKDLSELLCKSLDCGNTVLSATKMHDKTMQWIFKSLHPTNQTTNLNQSSIVLNDTNICTQKAAYVVCSGSVKPQFDTPRDKCVGNVVVSFEDQWLPVCTNALQNKQEQDAMCEALECGQAVKMTGYFGPKPGNKPFISELQCSSTEKMSLKSCNKITAKTSTCTPAVLQCNKWKKMTVSETCSGIVVVHSNENRGQVSFDGWTNTDGDRLCKDLECGSVKSNQNYSTSEKHSVWGKTFNCTYQNNTENIWDCEMQNSSSQQLLSIDCRDKPRVTLSEKCGGAVMINEIQVCDTHWKKEYSDMICQEQNCSNALHFSTTGPQPDPATDYYHVSCDDYHHELGQCKRVKGKCAGKLVSVNCVGNVQFNTTEKCGGSIKVSYIKNTWEHVCTKELSDTFKEQLCKKLDCVGLNTTYRPSKREQLVSSIGLECTDDHMDIRHCLNSNLSCEGVKPAEVFCKGYKAHTPPKKESKPVPVVPIILGVGLFLVLVILIVIFVRIYTVKKAKNAMNDPSRMLSRKEVEFESGDYEDVTSKENEMEDLSRGRFRSEAEVMMETDARSTSSFPYDDIDEAAEAQPLTSQAATAGASRDIHEDALNKNGVTYEVDDPQENYDDIEASSEITQTKAEVHNSPVTTPESESAVVPPGLVPGDVDYLVPGQDG